MKSQQKSLVAWTKQKWRTNSGKPSLETGERYLPDAAWKSLKPGEKAATNRAKKKGMKSGKQFVPQPEKVAEKTAGKRKTYLDRLRDIEGHLIEFGWIDPTKRLLAGLRNRGVNVNRWGSHSNYSPFMREIQVPAARNGGSHAGSPVLDLWHEAGHDLTRNLKSSKMNPVAYRINPVAAASRERTANRAAAKAIGKLGGDLKLQADYRGYANKHYASYRKLPADLGWKPRIPKDAFAR